MLKEYLFYLKEIGLSDIQIQIYEHILNNRTGTINEIKEKFNFSYSQVSYNLSVLEEIGLLFSSKSDKNKKYYRIDPKVALNEVLNEKVKDFKKQIDKIDETIKIHESVKGVCIKDINFYHYSDINLAVDNYYKLINNATNEICMSALPLILIKKLEPVLYSAFMRGIKLLLYFSVRDFETITDYFDKITDILKRIGITIVQTEERTCQYMRYNDIIVNNGIVLIDSLYFNTVLYIDDEIFHFDGFYGPYYAKESKKWLDIKSIVKKITISNSEQIHLVHNVIKKNGPITARELSRKTKIGGGKLKEIINFLLNEKLIDEKIEQSGVGRPSKIYTIISL